MKKNQFLRKLLLLAVCFTFMINAQAQSNLISNAFAVITSDTAGLASSEFTILLEDTTNISQITILLGSQAESSNLVLYTFDYDVSTSLPTGFSYSRTQKTLSLGAGTFYSYSTYFGTVKIKDNTGIWRPNYNFITN